MKKEFLYLKRVLLVVIFCLLSLSIVEYAESNVSGVIAHTNRPGDTPGCSCHCNTPNASTVVTLSTNATTFAMGQTYAFTITITNSAESKGGCNVSCWRGTLTAGTDGLKKLGSQLTHKTPKALTATWSFTYTAPPTIGPDTIYAIGMAANGDGSDGNLNCSDQWSFAPKFIIDVAGPGPSISLSRTAVSFGSVRVGSLKSDTMKVNSTGTGPLTISTSTLVSGSVFSNAPVTQNRTISAGSSETETISFQPVSRGVFSDTLVITNDATNVSDRRKTVVVTGKGIDGVFSGLNTIDFGLVALRKKKTFTYIFSNTGDDTLFLSGNPIVSGKGFSLESNPPILNIPPAGKDSFVVGFTPDTTSLFSGTATIHILNNHTPMTLSLSGTGIVPQISADSSTIEFGKCDTGLIQTRTFIYGNKGSVDLAITGITLTGDPEFSLAPVNLKVLGPLQFDTLTITFLPKTIGIFNGLLRILSEDDSLSVTVHGEGGLPATKSVRSEPKNPDLSLSLLPNPSTGFRRVFIAVSEPEEIQLELCDVEGKVLKEYGKLSLKTGENFVDLSMIQFSSGNYFLRAISKGVTIAGTRFIMIK